MKRYPKGGAAYAFAFPFRQSQVAEPAWRGFFRSLLSRFGAALDRDIWRFRFPAIPEERPVFTRECLTGNHFYWWRW